MKQIAVENILNSATMGIVSAMMSNGLMPRTFKYCLKFCNCCDVKRTAAENILNTVSMGTLKMQGCQADCS